MSDNKTMIRFYSVLLVVFAALTYAVDLNGQFHFIQLNSPIVSNSFCFAILSGVLTGIIVALAAELRQYLLHKRQARNALYAVASEMYALISVQRAGLKYYINNQNSAIPENIGGDYAQQPILLRVSQFRSIDYSPFLKNDTIQISLKSFRKQIDLVETTARNLTTLKIAYNETQMAFWEKKDNESKVTASSLVMLNALHEEHNALKDCLVVIDAFCSAFEIIDNNRFNWKQGKKAVDDLGKKIEADVHFNPTKE